MQRKNQIKKVEGEIEKAKLELNKAHEAHLKTQETLNATQSEVADLGWYNFFFKFNFSYRKTLETNLIKNYVLY